MISLQKLFGNDNIQQNNFILIQDTKEASGGIFINCFIEENLKLGVSVNFLSLENNPAVLASLKKSEQFKSYFLNDFKQWHSVTKEECDSKAAFNPKTILQHIQSNLKPATKNLVIIDSLSYFMMLWPDKCYKVLKQLVNLQGMPENNLHQIISVLHTDVLPGGKKFLTMFEQLASTNVIVDRNGKNCQVIINYRKASGRIVQHVEYVYLDKDGKLATKDVLDTKKRVEEKENMQQLSCDITFKLELEDKEKLARSELVLPYIRSGNSNGTGEIHYQPDAVDDWDEEDPDDDLNI